LSLYLETFKKYELPRDEQLKYIEYMLADVQRLTGNITRILNLARLENKKYKTEFSGLDPAAVIQSFLKKNAHLFTGSRIQFNNDLEQGVRLKINPSLFEILIMNLMTNAIKYNTSAAPSINIRTTQIPGKVQILVQDNGIGFIASEKKKIFKKFYQVGSSDNMSAKGSGLGLYLVQSIAKIHRGSISATSTGPGKGATFKLTLPLPQKKQNET
jgi:signal transduction histidine kinase